MLHVSAVLGSHTALCLSLLSCQHWACCELSTRQRQGSPPAWKTPASVPGKEEFPGEDVDHRSLGGVFVDTPFLLFLSPWGLLWAMQRGPNAPHSPCPHGRGALSCPSLQAHASWAAGMCLQGSWGTKWPCCLLMPHPRERGSR